MKKVLTALIPALLFIASCGHDVSNEASTNIQARADSIVGARMEEINQRAMEDLEKRMTIEVKAKADSIVQARKKQHASSAASPAIHK